MYWQSQQEYESVESNTHAQNNTHQRTQANNEQNVDTMFNHMLDDSLHGMYTHLEMFSLELLFLLPKIGAPHFIFKCIMDLIQEHILHKVQSIGLSFKNCDAVIDHLSKQFQMQSLKPSIKTVSYKDKTYPTVVHNAYAMTDFHYWNQIYLQMKIYSFEAKQTWGPHLGEF